MRNQRNILLCILALLMCLPSAAGQKVSSAKARQESEPPLAPLTEAERALDLRSIVAHQPDFIADLRFFYAEGFGGFGASEHIARKGNKYRVDNDFLIVMGEPGKAATRLYPEDKVYDDLETGINDDSPGAGGPFNPKTLGSKNDITFTALGTLMIDGHKCLKIQATKNNGPEKLFLFAAEDLKYLIIVAQVLAPPRNSVQRLSNISLDVPDSLFEIPKDYKGTEHRHWTKVTSAKISYGGKPSKDYGVFRSPTDELFVWVNDARYPWHYLVRLKEATAESAFQGMLVTKDGKYVWQTNEQEAFSGPDYEAPKDRLYTCKGRGCPKVVVTPNSVTFPSNDYGKDNSLIEITW
jgi:hypothetical protein